MANFALVENGKVENVIFVSNDDVLNLEFPESEQVGQQFIASLGVDGVWLQTSYNANFRKRLAVTGYFYCSKCDAFILPKCHDEAVLDPVTADWVCSNGDHKVVL